MAGISGVLTVIGGKCRRPTVGVIGHSGAVKPSSNFLTYVRKLVAGDLVLYENPLSSHHPHLLSIVSQSYIITPQHLFLPTLVPLLRGDKALYPSAFKVMVFLPTARQAGFATYSRSIKQSAQSRAYLRNPFKTFTIQAD